MEPNKERRRHILGSGLPVDSTGGPIIDPTRNVIALVEANAQAAEAIRTADIRYNEALSTHVKEIGALRSTYNELVSNLRASHAETLRISDLDRLDKTRQVDVLAASASAAALATAVQTLASTADRNADALRNLVNATAATMAKQTSDQAATLSAATDSLVKDINARIAELQKSSYQGVGKSSVADPMMAELIAEMRTLVKGRDINAGQREVESPVMTQMLATVARLEANQQHNQGQRAGMSDSAKLAIGVLTAVTLLMGAYTFTQKSDPTAAAIAALVAEIKTQADKPAPQVIYTPASPNLPTVPTTPGR